MPDALGLDPVMHEIYRALLQHDGCTPDDLAEELRRPLTEVHSALERLGTLGLAGTVPERPACVLPRDPKESLGPALQHLEAEVAERKSQVQQARDAVAALVAAYADHQGSSSAGAPETCHGVEPIRMRVERLLEDATSRVLCFVPASAHEIMLNVGVPNLQRLVERSVDVQLIFMGSLRNDPIARDHAELLQTIIGSVRTSPALPLPMLVIDSAVTVLPADDDGGHGGDPVAQVVHNHALAVGLAALFERIWASSEPLAQGPTPDPSTGLTSSERGLLELLGRGLTDAAAARKLGVSLRTVRRMMSEIMSRLGAHSRFEAGARAAARGWISGPSTSVENGPATTPLNDATERSSPGQRAGSRAGVKPGAARSRVAAAFNG